MAKAKQCELCGYSIYVALQEHHLKPRSNGGGNHPDNLITVCSNCHGVLTSMMGKLNGNLPAASDIRKVANLVNGFYKIVAAREKAGVVK